jgi:hypothetical protein
MNLAMWRISKGAFRSPLWRGMAGVKIAAEKEGRPAHSKRKDIMHWNSP